MPTNLSDRACESSTYIVTATFTDEDGDSVIPDSITWTLTDKKGNVINSREDVEVSSPATAVDIVLSGDDLAVTSTGTLRILTVEAVYDSDAGLDLPLKDEARFHITDLKNIG